MKQNEGESVEQVSWNLSQGIIQEIAIHLAKASDYYIAGNTAKALYNLQAVRLRISPSLNKEELEAIRLKEKDFMIQIKLQQCDTFRTQEVKNKIAKAELRAELIYTDYNDLIMSALDKYGYGLQIKENQTRMI